MQGFFDFINNVVAGLMGFLPDSPFPNIIDSIFEVPFLSAINYFVPVSTFLVILAPWLVAIGVYLLFRAILRWAGVV